FGRAAKKIRGQTDLSTGRSRVLLDRDLRLGTDSCVRGVFPGEVWRLNGPAKKQFGSLARKLLRCASAGAELTRRSRRPARTPPRPWMMPPPPWHCLNRGWRRLRPPRNSAFANRTERGWQKDRRPGRLRSKHK